MRYILFFSVLLLSTYSLIAQENVNLKGGFAAEGYDVVAYFQNEVHKGDKQHSYVYQGVTYKFHTLENLQSFQQNPDKYIPQYGGYCAYAMAISGEKVGINPKTYIITDGKLYLFYNNWGINTLKKWNEERPESLKIKADTKWNSLIKTQ